MKLLSLLLAFIITSLIVTNIFLYDFNKRIDHLESVTFESSRCLNANLNSEEFE